MWAEISASRSSIWRASVRIWPPTRASSKSARCMKAPKFRPMPMGSTIVNRTWPGGRLVSRRNIAAWSTPSDADRPAAGPSTSRLARSGNGRSAGNVNRVAIPSLSRGSAEPPPGRVSEVDAGLADPDHRRDILGKRAVGPRGVVPPRGVGVDLARDLVERGLGLRHPLVPAGRHRVPAGLVVGADLLLEGSVLSRRASGSLASCWTGQFGHPLVVDVDRLAHLAGELGLGLDLLPGEDLVDLPEPLVAVGFAIGDGLRLLLLGLRQRLVADPGHAEPFLLERLVGRASGFEHHRFEVDQRLEQRVIELADLNPRERVELRLEEEPAPDRDHERHREPDGRPFQPDQGEDGQEEQDDEDPDEPPALHRLRDRQSFEHHQVRLELLKAVEHLVERILDLVPPSGRRRGRSGPRRGRNGGRPRTGRRAWPASTR